MLDSDALLLRLRSSEQGTEGKWFSPDFSCCTIELPWNNNISNYSCIPAGTYTVKRYHSNKFQDCFIVTGVEGRSYILTHWGNWAGDKRKGWKTNSEGCILLGEFHATIYNQRAVGVSKPTFEKFMESAKGVNKFQLSVLNLYEETL